MRKNKKGSVEGLFTILIIIFICAISWGVGSYIWDEFSTTDLVQDNTYANASFQGGVRDSLELTDNLILFLFGFLGIIVLALASTIRASPAFFAITFIVFGVAVLVAVIFSNAYETFDNSTVISGMTINFEKTDHLMEYLPFYIFGLGVLTLIVIYARGAFGQVE